MITADFDAIIQEKRDKRMVRQSRDGLGKYKYLLLSSIQSQSKDIRL
jgi:hypothetical protein